METKHLKTPLKKKKRNAIKAQTYDSDVKMITGVSVKVQNHYKRAPRTQLEDLSHLYMVTFTVARAPTVNVLTPESRLRPLRAYFVWGCGEWHKAPEGESLENVNIRNANVESRH